MISQSIPTNLFQQIKKIICSNYFLSNRLMYELDKKYLWYMCGARIHGEGDKKRNLKNGKKLCAEITIRTGKPCQHKTHKRTLYCHIHL